MPKFLFFDCDSTLSSIEGVDELAGLRSAEVLAQVEELTNAAMDGTVAIDEIFARRLDLIRPTRDECDTVAQRYIETLEPDAAAVIAAAKEAGWTPLILSGGFAPAIRPLADLLGIDTVEAVPLTFKEDGSYQGFGSGYPTTRNGGKTEIIATYRTLYHPEHIIMVGDGVSDLETKPAVDLFVGFGRYADREKVRAGAGTFIMGMAELPPLLEG
jgi:phosphoserine phosphatase